MTAKVIRIVVFLALVLGNGMPAWGQSVPGCYPRFCPLPPAMLGKAQGEPIRRTVQVDVPIPCTPMACPPGGAYQPPAGIPTRACQLNLCYPPLSPTRPIEVNIDVRVRPEPCRPPEPARPARRDFGALGPIIGMAAATLTVPIRLLESVFPGWDRCRVPDLWHGHSACPPPPLVQFVPPAPLPLPFSGTRYPTSVARGAASFQTCSSGSPRFIPFPQEGNAR